MNLLLDTNILIYLSKDPQRKLLTKVINPDSRKLFISVAALAELKSIAIQNNWSENKWQLIDTIIEESVLVEINENLIDTYAQIDAFSQRRNIAFKDYKFNTPRNMGKNDLWIASTAALLGLTLITTDADFDHLHRVFMEVNRISPEKLISS